MGVLSRVGEQYTTKAGRVVTVVEYNGARDLVVEFKDGLQKRCEMGNLRKGSVSHPQDFSIPEVGSRWLTNAFGWCTVVEYSDARNVMVEFDTPYRCSLRTESRSIRCGELRNPLQPDERGYYMGIGSFDSHNKAYEVWNHIKRRVGNENGLNPAYADVIVCNEWKNYQNFAGWYTQQIGAGKPGWHLDKDILVKNCREYSPTTCIIVPAHINTALTKRKAHRGETPIGVTFDDGKPSCQYTENGVHIFRGYFPTVEAAFAIYKEAKEKHIKGLATKWKSQIDQRAYDALMNYVVEITD